MNFTKAVNEFLKRLTFIEGGAYLDGQRRPEFDRETETARITNHGERG